MSDFKNQVLLAMRKQILFTPHSLEQMSRLERMITLDEIREVVLKGEIIEDYPEDKRGRSCLICGRTSLKRVVHVVCSPKEDYLAIITAYVPNALFWENAFRNRKR